VWEEEKKKSKVPHNYSEHRHHTRLPLKIELDSKWKVMRVKFKFSRVKTQKSVSVFYTPKRFQPITRRRHRLNRLFLEIFSPRSGLKQKKNEK
jgi:hypothetical protein